MPLSWNLRTLTSWNPLGHSRPVTGLLYLQQYCDVRNGRWVPELTFWRNLLPLSSGTTLQKEVVGASTMWVLLYQMTGYHTPEDSYLPGQCCENLKCHLCTYQFSLGYDSFILVLSWLIWKTASRYCSLSLSINWILYYTIMETSKPTYINTIHSYFVMVVPLFAVYQETYAVTIEGSTSCKIL